MSKTMKFSIFIPHEKFIGSKKGKNYDELMLFSHFSPSFLFNTREDWKVSYFFLNFRQQEREWLMKRTESKSFLGRKWKKSSKILNFWWSSSIFDWMRPTTTAKEKFWGVFDVFFRCSTNHNIKKIENWTNYKVSHTYSYSNIGSEAKDVFDSYCDECFYNNCNG